MSYILTRKARADLDNIWLFGAKKWTRKQATDYQRLLIKECMFYSDYPKLGSQILDYEPPVFKIVFKSHNIFYQIEGVNIRILRILHQRMDLTKNL